MNEKKGDVLKNPLLQDMTWEDLKSCISKDYALILPVGSTEQHGPHLPLGTDGTNVEQLAKLVATHVEAVVAPTVRYTWIPWYSTSFPGSICIRQSTVITLIQEILQEFIRHKFKRFVVFNGHWENNQLTYDAAKLALQESKATDVKILILGWWELCYSDLVPKIFSDVYPEYARAAGPKHGAFTETSMVLALTPNLVKKEKMINYPGPKERIPALLLPPPPRHLNDSGSYWNSSAGSKEKGEQMRDQVINRLVELIKSQLA